MKTTKTVILAAWLCAGSLAAQEPLDRQVEVTRDYEPSVREVLKQGIAPDMADTAQMRPGFDYTLTPRPLTHAFEASPIAPAAFAVADPSSDLPGYLRLGAGYPLQSTAVARYTRALSGRVGVGLAADHYARWADITNDMGISEDALATDNHAGGWVDYRPSENLFFKLDLGYDYDAVSRYGYYRAGATSGLFNTSEEMMRQYHRRAGARLSFGNPAPELRRIGITGSVAIEHFADRYRYDQLRADADLSAGLRAGPDGRVILGARATLNRGLGNLDGTEDPFGRVDAAYEYRADGLWVRVGVGVGYTENLPVRADVDSSRLFILPELILEKELAGGAAIPFAHVRSEMTDNSYAALAARNPYLYSGQHAPLTVSYIGRGGVRGTLVGMFRYMLYGGYTLQKAATFWANAYPGFDTPANGATWPFYDQQGNVFTVLTDDLNYIEAGVDLEVDFLNALTWRGAANWRDYSPDAFDEAWGMAELTASASLSYNHRDRLYLTASLEYTGRRPMYSLSSGGTAHELPGQADLCFSADYFVSQRLGVFAQASNLLGHKLYRFDHFPELGTGVLAGIKLSF